MNLKKLMQKIKQILNSITNLIYDVAVGFMWIFLKVCLYIYRFIKYIWYGLLWPFVFIVVLFVNLTSKSKEVDVEKLRRKSQKLKEKRK